MAAKKNTKSLFAARVAEIVPGASLEISTRVSSSGTVRLRAMLRSRDRKALGVPASWRRGPEAP